MGSYTGVITASGQTSTNYTITYARWQSDGQTGGAYDHGHRCVASLRFIGPDAWCVTYTGFVNDETSSVLDAGRNVALTRFDTAPDDSGGQLHGVITASGQTSTNYTITYAVAGNLTVTPAALTITAKGVSRVYGASDPALWRVPTQDS